MSIGPQPSRATRTASAARRAAIAGLALAVALAALPGAPARAAVECEPATTIDIPARMKAGQVVDPVAKAYKLADGSIVFMGRLTVDADGAPKSYHPIGSKGLDALANGGEPGNWWALATDAVDARGRPTCTAAGNPIVQGPGDPAPGFYVSRSTMTDPAVSDCRKQRRYVDSSAIAYVALSPAILKYDFRSNTGNLAVVFNPRTQKTAHALFADVAPKYGRGEGSIKLAELLGYRSSPRNGGTGVRENVFLILPSRLGFPKDQATVEAAVAPAFEAWGGQARMQACAAKLQQLPK